ncbi:hypothetical protein GCM10019059_40800 [Camelimonas fluminis]|uniref:Uncharacterized protein n=1 Tax=Camelimonas fluminis TaxID=1576911 RepID=A0ABV7UCH1_9HYPH|nr:hypothetical protein [Camelimonas fluminis]GHE77661.1 hypothetical protein GCM10019059_40800 [Camelimonas fluminis]
MSDRDAHPHYNRQNYPHFICHSSGNFDIYARADGNCASIPTESGACDGCHATHFGDLNYVKVTLGVDAAAILHEALFRFGMQHGYLKG